MTSAERSIADPGSFAPVTDGLHSTDPLGFPGYPDMQAAARERSGIDESVVAGPASIDGIDVELALFEFAYLGGSMGEVAGERLARAMERAAERKVPFVLRTSTGGARMQEGMVALAQMPKTVLARTLLSDAGVPYIAVLGNPSTGGVFASLGSLADVTLAESDATIGFAGPRVAESFMGEPLQGGSHTAATAFAHGLVDEVVAPSDARAYVARALKVLAPDAPQAVVEPRAGAGPGGPDDAWELVTAVRDARRTAGDLLGHLGDPQLRLRGDRCGGDDPALSVAVTRLEGRRVLVLALERTHHPGPGAFRKARRCMDIAARLGMPIVSLVDTRGADPSSRSENAGIASEIAATFDRLLRVRVPTISVVTGEGGSGGALAFACTDLLFTSSASFFAVIAPEGAAQILWRDEGRAAEAARLLRLTPADLIALGIVDIHLSDQDSEEHLGHTLAYHLDRLTARDIDDVLAARHERWRRRI